MKWNYFYTCNSQVLVIRPVAYVVEAWRELVKECSYLFRLRRIAERFLCTIVMKRYVLLRNLSSERQLICIFKVRNMWIVTCVMSVFKVSYNKLWTLLVAVTTGVGYTRAVHAVFHVKRARDEIEIGNVSYFRTKGHTNYTERLRK